MHAAVVMLFWLLVVHALADFPLQGDFLSKAKNHTTDLGREWWPIALPAHALIHAGAVALVTHSVAFGMIEFFAHGVIDFLKCDNHLSLRIDQVLHVGCKVVYAAAVWRLT
jgi:hypothetical protein